MTDDDLWSWTNYADDPAASALADTTDGALAASNVFDTRLGKVWRSANVANGSAVIEVDFGVTRPVGLIGAFGVNRGGASDVRLQLSSAPGLANILDVSVVSDFDDEFGIAIHEVLDGSGNPAAIPARFFAVRFINHTSRVSVGRVWGGAIDWRPAYNHGYQRSSRQVVDLSSKQVSERDGTVFVNRQKILHRHEASYQAITDEERAGEQSRMDSLAGISRQLVFVPGPREGGAPYHIGRDPILGYLESTDDITPMYFNAWRREIAIRASG